MGDVVDTYLDTAVRMLERIRADDGEAVGAAARLLADTVERDGRIFAFGAGHSSLPAQDLVYRAGGLALINLLSVPGLTGIDLMPAPLGSALERVPGLATATLEASPARSGDLLIVISLSGRNMVPVEMAQYARELGMSVIGVTSVAYAESAETAPRHPSGTFLHQNCDVVLDSRIAPGDAELTLDGLPTAFGSVSTIVTSALLQSTVAGAIALLVERGVVPPLLRSGNVEGGREWNAEMFRKYAGRIFYRYD